jgi:hypothetical protein
MRFVFLALLVALYLAIAIVLVRKYLRTRDVGLAWLGGAVVVWPLLSLPFEYGQRVLIDRIGSGPFATVGELVMYIAYSRQLIGLALLFAAVLFLGQTKSQPEPSHFKLTQHRRSA